MKNIFRYPIIGLGFVLILVGTAYFSGRVYSVAQRRMDSSAITRQADPRQSQTAPAKTFLSRDKAHQRFIELMNDATSAGYEGAKRLAEFGSMIDPADIPGLMDAAVGLSATRQRDILFDILIRSWAQTDPQAAMNWAWSLPSDDAALLHKAIVDIGSIDPQVAESYLGQLADISARDDDIRSISAGLGKSDPAAALNWLNQMATGSNYDTGVNNLFTRLSQPKVYEQLTPEGSHQTVIATSGYVPDISAAISLLDNVVDPVVRDAAIGKVAGNWAWTDPNAARIWAQTLPDSDRVSALNSIVTIWSQSDPAAAAAFVQGDSDPTAFLGVDRDVIKYFTLTSPSAALDFTYALPESEVKNQALNDVLMRLAQSNFVTAWTDAAALPPVENPVGIMTNLVSGLAKKDPVQAAGLIAQFPAGTAQDNAMSTVATTWIQQDPQAFTVWLTSLPTGEVRDTAIAQLVSSSQAAKNPVGVLEWVNTVSNPQTKAALLQQLAPAPTTTAP